MGRRYTYTAKTTIVFSFQVPELCKRQRHTVSHNSNPNARLGPGHSPASPRPIPLPVSVPVPVLIPPPRAPPRLPTMRLLDLPPIEHVPVSVIPGAMDSTRSLPALRLCFPLPAPDELQRTQALRGLPARPLRARARSAAATTIVAVPRCVRSRPGRARRGTRTRASSGGRTPCVAGGELRVDRREGVVDGLACEIAAASSGDV